MATRETARKPSTAPPADSIEVLAEERRRSEDQFVWQIPGLAVAAQAFLYNRAMDPSTTSAGRLLVALVATLTALATIQFLLKHRYREEIYAKAVDARRAARDRETLEGSKAFKDAAKGHMTDSIWGGNSRIACLARNIAEASSTITWLVASVGFLTVDCIVLVSALVELSSGGSLFAVVVR